MAASTFKFDAQTTEQLEQLKEHYHITSKAAVLRRAVGLLNLVAESDEKYDLVLKPKNGEGIEQKLVFGQ